MELKIITLEDDYRIRQKLIKDGEVVYSVSDLSECPEDAIVGRDLVSCEELLEIVKKFNGEKIPENVEIVVTKTWEEYESFPN